MLELILFGKIRVQSALAAACLGLKLGQAVIALRADNQIDHRLTAHDLFALGLGHTARDTDFQIGLFRLQPFVTAQLRVYLFRRFFADVAGVQQDHIRVIGRIRGHIAFAGQRFGHTLTVVNVHLTAISLDIQLFWRGHCRGSGKGFGQRGYIRIAPACNAEEFNRFCAKIVYRAACVTTVLKIS